VSEEVLELVTADLILEEEVEPPRPKIVPKVLSRPIRERSRARPQEKVEDAPRGLASKAASFLEQALEAQKAGDLKAAIRHVKIAITFDPQEPRYRELLSKLERAAHSRASNP
jgi:hypothetical protein